ncbi:MAG TPA: class I SAM-dependent methyltransferase [Solirubrobacteraceae bacterium]|nr:class I SAM-dependent methyltransferase [Solirubrobacteraceae bacterium]
MTPTVRPLRHDPSREEAELRAYLGDAYDHDRLVRWREQLEDEARALGDEQRLYRESEAYLYNLTAFAMTGTKLPYLRELLRVVPPGARVLDVGCGIGSDGLMLLEAGYEVEFADFDNPSTRYLRWRLERRGLAAPVHDLDAGPLPGRFHAAYAFDVLEHVDDPLGLLGAMEAVARVVCVNLVGDDDSLLHHRELPVGAIAARARERGLIVDRPLHDGRVRLLLYG